MMLTEADERAILALRERLHGRKLWANPPYPADEATDLAILYAIRDGAVDRAWRESAGIPEDIEALCAARDEVGATLGPDERQWYLARWAALIDEEIRSREWRRAHPLPGDYLARQRTWDAEAHIPIRRTAEGFARDRGARVDQVGFGRDDFATENISVVFRWHRPGAGPIDPPGSVVVKVPCRLDRPSEIRGYFRPAEEAIPADALPEWRPAITPPIRVAVDREGLTARVSADTRYAQSLEYGTDPGTARPYLRRPATRWGPPPQPFDTARIYSGDDGSTTHSADATANPPGPPPPRR